MKEVVEHRIVVEAALDQLRDSAAQADPAKMIRSCGHLRKTIADLLRLDKEQCRSLVDLCQTEIMKVISSIQPKQRVLPQNPDLQRKAQLAYSAPRRRP